jgi:hypothetical protein
MNVPAAAPNLFQQASKNGLVADPENAFDLENPIDQRQSSRLVPLFAKGFIGYAFG